MNKKYNRRSLRLKHYNYSSAGLYFVTIATKHHTHYFGEIINQQLTLNDAGLMVANHYLNLAQNYAIETHEYVVMPNHFHAIIEVLPQNTLSLGEIIGAFKSLTTNEYIKGVKTKNFKPFDGRVWQRNFYEHVIRNEKSYFKLSEYIQNNPLVWEKDIFYC